MNTARRALLRTVFAVALGAPAPVLAEFTILDREGVQRASSPGTGSVRIRFRFACDGNTCPDTAVVRNIDGVANDVEAAIVAQEAVIDIVHDGTWQLKQGSPVALEVRIEEQS